MKKTLLIFTLLLTIIETKAQKLPWYQSGQSSCWAASLGWVSKRLGDSTQNQCSFIKYINPLSICSPDTNNADPISQTKMSYLTKTYLTNYLGEKNNSIGLNYIKYLFSINKPLIYNFRYDGGSSHIVVLDSIENQNFAKLNKNISLIKVSDPWPKNEGNEYYITYERYYSQFYNNNEPEDIASGKYVLFYTDESLASGVTNFDKEYLSKVIYDSTSNNKVINFLEDLKNSILDTTNTLSDNFFRITNLPKNNIGSLGISTQYSLLSISVDSLIRNLIPTLLNMQFNEKLVSINQYNTIISMATVSNKKVYGITAYEFYNNWILYHIEKGTVLQNLHNAAILKNMNLKVGSDNDGIIIQCADTYFAITKKRRKYYVYDLYGDGFDKIKFYPVNKENKFLAFNKFQKLLKTNFYKKN